MVVRILLLILGLPLAASYLCGCGGCRGVNGKACVRCCTGYVKRSGNASMWRKVSQDDRNGSENNWEQGHDGDVQEVRLVLLRKSIAQIFIPVSEAKPVFKARLKHHEKICAKRVNMLLLMASCHCVQILQLANRHLIPVQFRKIYQSMAGVRFGRLPAAGKHSLPPCPHFPYLRLFHFFVLQI